MKCLWKAANITKRDKIRNKHVREMFRTATIKKYIEEKIIKWFGHTVRMQPDQLVAQTYNMKLTGL